MSASAAAAAGTTVAGRYVVEEVLGRGGMAVVYRVCERQTGRAFALKQLQCGEERLRDQVTHLFQREYQILADLSHPHIVSVHEYGFDAGSPYYTMELVDGEDLSRADRIDWRSACALLRDVLSALAMLHSRRWVHRDVTPRNVRRTADGRAKLFDFGALTPMGATTSLVGTPAYVPPEALHGQPLDGRADLYSVGALAYWMLTGRHAYPARRFDELRERWRSDPVPPVKLVPEVPESLSALVLSLLSLDLLGRPTTAWEVIDRLSAIADLPAEVDASAAQAYLVTPTLVGRERELLEARTRVVQAMRGRGATLWIHGATGSGRSRLLSNCVLEARLLGLHVLQASGSEGRHGDFGVLRALLREWLAVRPEGDEPLPREVELVLDAEDGALTVTEQTALLADGRSRIVRFLIALAERRGLLVAVDDVEQADPASSAVLGELIQAAPRHKLVVALTLRTDRNAQPWGAMLRRAALAFELGALSESDTEALMRSVFGDAANLKSLAHVIHGLAQGNPKACMSLAQQLLDRGLVRYESGRFVLPSDPLALGLSHDLKHALAARLDSLGPLARELAEALALVDCDAALPTDHYARLVDAPSEQALIAASSELIATCVLELRAGGYGFSHVGLAEVLRQRLKPQRARALHVRLAAVYEAGAQADPFLRAYHLQQAGDHVQACALLADRARKLNNGATRLERVNVHYRLAKRAYLTALEQGGAAGANVRDLFEMRRSLVNLAAYYDPRLVGHARPLIEQLRHDTGLDLWAGLVSIADPKERIMAALGAAGERHTAIPEAERCLDPGQAVIGMAYLVGVLAGAYGRSLDLAGLESLPPLIEPFRPLSPIIDVLADVVLVSRDGASGQDVIDRVIALLARIDADPATPGNPMMIGSMNTLRYYLGVWEARRGGDAALARADQIEQRVRDWEEKYPSSVGLGRFRAWHVRLLAYLSNGEAKRAAYCRERIELLQLDGIDPLVTPNVRTSAYLEARVHASTDSLLELRAAIDTIVELSDGEKSWLPVLHWTRGEYHRIRGDWASAQAELEAAIALMTPGRHVVWLWAVPSLACVLLASGQAARARELAAEGLSRCSKVFGSMRVDFERMLALAEAATGDAAAAAARLDASIAAAQGLLGGVLLGQLYEARARVALRLDDAATFAACAAHAERYYCAGRMPSLVARYKALLEEGERVSLHASDDADARAHVPERQALLLQTVATAMQGCSDARQRARRALQLLLERSGATRGYLFGMERGGVRLLASAGSRVSEAPAELVRRIEQLVDRECADVTELQGGAAADGHVVLADGARYVPLVLRSARDDGEVLTAVAALAVSEHQAVRLPWRLCEAISDHLLDAGDLMSLVITQ